jgi:hypothetical protein
MMRSVGTGILFILIFWTSCAEETIPDRQVYRFLEAYWVQDWEEMKALSSDSLLPLVNFLEESSVRAEELNINPELPFNAFFNSLSVDDIPLSVDSLSENDATVIAQFGQKNFRFHLKNKAGSWKVHIPNGPMWNLAEELE